MDPKRVVVGYASGAELIQASVEPFEINFSGLTGKTVIPSVNVITVGASSVLDNYRPDGLPWSMQPGWHAARNPTYPQTLTVDFIKSRSFSKVRFEAQDRLAKRMPKEVRMEISDDGTDWTPIASENDLCAVSDPDGWRTVKTPKGIQARFLRIEIMSNCGDPDLLTLKGLSVE